MVKLFLEVGVIVLTAFNFTLAEGRPRARDKSGPKGVVEIYRDGLLEIYKKWNVKGLYQKGRVCLINNTLETFLHMMSHNAQIFSCKMGLLRSAITLKRFCV